MDVVETVSATRKKMRTQKDKDKVRPAAKLIELPMVSDKDTIKFTWTESTHYIQMGCPRFIK